MGKNKLIIAGPCAIETKNQFFATVESIYQQTDIIRCGVWKARTCPHNYAGKGDKALNWIQTAQEKYKTRFAIEVGTIQHVKQALDHNINTFWVGARTTSNPFSIQEIAKYLNGINRTIEMWVKNPIIADLDLWFGAIERFKMNKIKNIKAIHRGFFSEKNIKYRNHPRWDLLKNFKLKYPTMPVICDPSHITGDSNLIEEMSKLALNKNLDGLMIEVHNQPNSARSDKQQQLSPQKFIDIIHKLQLK